MMISDSAFKLEDFHLAILVNPYKALDILPGASTRPGSPSQKASGLSQLLWFPPGSPQLEMDLDSREVYYCNLLGDYINVKSGDRQKLAFFFFLIENIQNAFRSRFISPIPQNLSNSSHFQHLKTHVHCSHVRRNSTILNFYLYWFCNNMITWNQCFITNNMHYWIVFPFLFLNVLSTFPYHLDIQ